MLHAGLSLCGRLLGNQKLSILIYHQVLENPDPMRPTEPTQEVFDWQMKLLARYFTPISLDQALRGLSQGNLPANAVCVTFDDGYLNNLTIAQPILAKYNIPATVYVATAFSEGVNMWNDRVIHLFSDPTRHHLQLQGQQYVLEDWEQRRNLAGTWLKKLKYLPVEERLIRVDELYSENALAEQSALMMTPTQIRELSDKGVVIGAHTVNHPILKVLSLEAQRQEMSLSREQLQSWTNTDVRHFAYPNGVIGQDLDEQTIACAKQLGFASAVVTNWGTSNSRTSPWQLQRFTPWDTTASRFHVRLLRNQVLS